MGEAVRAAHLLANTDILAQTLTQWPPDSDEARTLRKALGLVKLGTP